MTIEYDLYSYKHCFLGDVDLDDGKPKLHPGFVDDGGTLWVLTKARPQSAQYSVINRNQIRGRHFDASKIKVEELYLTRPDNPSVCLFNTKSGGKITFKKDTIMSKINSALLALIVPQFLPKVTATELPPDAAETVSESLRFEIGTFMELEGLTEPQALSKIREAQGDRWTEVVEATKIFLVAEAFEQLPFELPLEGFVPTMEQLVILDDCLKSAQDGAAVNTYDQFLLESFPTAIRANLAEATAEEVAAALTGQEGAETTEEATTEEEVTAESAPATQEPALPAPVAAQQTGVIAITPTVKTAIGTVLRANQQVLTSMQELMQAQTEFFAALLGLEETVEAEVPAEDAIVTE